MPALQKMITFQISGYLTEFSGGRAEITMDTSPANVREALDSLWSEHAGLRDRVLNELGEVRAPPCKCFRQQSDRSPGSGFAD